MCYNLNRFSNSNARFITFFAAAAVAAAVAAAAAAARNSIGSCDMERSYKIASYSKRCKNWRSILSVCQVLFCTNNDRI
jgi:hypothetical protein